MKINKLLPISLVIAMGIVDAKNQCFRPYNINVVNKSGGVATLLHAKDVAGMIRGSSLDNNRSKRLQVNDLGAHVSFEVGPEEQKVKASVSLYDATGAQPHIVLEQKGIKAFDVNTTHGKSFDVTINNESGGVATVTGCSAKELKIANGSRAKLNVHASAMANIRAGREGRKNSYIVQFFGKMGDNPSITIGGGEFFASGIKAKNVTVRVNNAALQRLSTGLGPKRRAAIHAHQNMQQDKMTRKVYSKHNKLSEKTASAAQK